MRRWRGTYCSGGDVRGKRGISEVSMKAGQMAGGVAEPGR